MTTEKINQKEYLKKYFSNDDKKKKKKKKKVGLQTVKIIDDDVDLLKIRPLGDDEFEILNTTEDAPQIVGIVDERGPADFSDKSKWKIIADDGMGDISIRQQSKASKRDEDEEENFFEINPKVSNKTSKADSSKNKVKNDEGITRIKSKSRHKDKSSRRKRKDSDSDLSFTRKSQSSSSSEDESRHRSNKKKKKREQSDDDFSPPRRKKSKSSKRKDSSDSDSDLSPPRNKSKRSGDDRRERFSNKNRSRSSSSESERRTKKSSSSRKSRAKGSDSDLSPPRRDERNKYEKSDLRKKRKEDSDQDLSPPRNRRRSRDSESPQKYRRDDRNRNNSPARKGRKPETPPRRLKKSRWSRRSRSRSPEVSEDKRMKKTLDGKTAGLQDAKALREETTAHKRREAEMFEKLSAEVSGKGQSVVIRDRKTGRRRDLEAEAAVEREKEERQREVNEQYEKWGRGLKQQEDREEKLKSDMHEMSKPLARYQDDEDLIKLQKNTLRESDPMLQFGREKLAEQGLLPTGTKTQLSAPPNRFGIKPGNRWDGVDRSNGFEKKWFEAQNTKKARREEAYKYSTSDM